LQIKKRELLLQDYFDALRSIVRPLRAADFPRSLRPMRELLDALGSPHLKFPAVVVTGSVGKGSTCLQIARELEAQGLRVGLYIGPHLHSFRERFSINGEMISPAEFIEGVNAVSRIRSIVSLQNLTTFELATALALGWFARREVDVAVMEVGIGGRWDAVNVVPNILSVFTPMEREHLAMLGGALQTIAWHKAGIIQPGSHTMTVEQSDAVMDILQMEAARSQATLTVFRHMEDMAAAAAWDILARIPGKDDLVGRSYNPTLSLPGRFEQITVNGRSVIIDGGHTARSAFRLRMLAEGKTTTDRPIQVIVGMLKDKPARDFLMAFDGPRFQITLTQAPGHRAAAPEDLAAGLQHKQVKIVQDLWEALAQVYDNEADLFIVTGSLRMAAAAREFYGLLDADALEEARQTREIFDGEDYLSKLRKRI
jgi:dihydrofolate synthase / folylpolyglutamate synthase